MRETHISLRDSAKISPATRSVCNKIQIGQILVGSHLRRVQCLTESIGEMKITVFHHNSEVILDFESLCESSSGIRSNSARTPAGKNSIPTLIGNTHIKSSGNFSVRISEWFDKDILFFQKKQNRKKGDSSTRSFISLPRFFLSRRDLPILTPSLVLFPQRSA